MSGLTFCPGLQGNCAYAPGHDGPCCVDPELGRDPMDDAERYGVYPERGGDNARCCRCNGIVLGLHYCPTEYDADAYDQDPLHCLKCGGDMMGDEYGERDPQCEACGWVAEGYAEGPPRAACGQKDGETSCRCGWAVDNAVPCEGRMGSDPDPEQAAQQGACPHCGDHHDAGRDCFADDLPF